jgi:GntR family transcriptional regulator/MocR family aminotransferase
MSPTDSRAFLAVDLAAAEPLYRQLYSRFRSAITEGVLKPGDRIPSARALARELGVARGTIETAYGLLAAEGYVLARGQAGTVVTPDIHLPRQPAAPVPASPSELRQAHSIFGGAFPEDPVPPVEIPPFQMGLPAMDAFPRKIWARLGARQLRAMQAPGMSYPSLFGLLALREAIAAYLLVARGISCTAEQIFITTGYRDTVHLMIQALLEPGDRVWVEDPGYPPTRELLRYAGLESVPVPVDEEGLVVGRGIAAAGAARAAVVTPAHQSPLCVSLSLRRRIELLDWAAGANAWILEDDYDGEYRYTSRPLSALMGLDRMGRVLYAGTFSKVMFPGIRLAYLVVPPALAGRFREVRRVFAPGIPAHTQEIVAAFINEGHFVRHIQRMRRLYAERRALSVAGFEDVLGPRMRVAPQPGGMHLILQMREQGADRTLAARMREHGMFADAVSDWASASSIEPGLLLSFTNIPTIQRAQTLARRMAALAD